MQRIGYSKHQKQLAQHLFHNKFALFNCMLRSAPNGVQRRRNATSSCEDQSKGNSTTESKPDVVVGINPANAGLFWSHAWIRMDVNRLAALIETFDPADKKQIDRVKKAFRYVFNDNVYIHHRSEDDILWPFVRKQLASATSPTQTAQEMHELVNKLEADHHEFDHLAEAFTQKLSAIENDKDINQLNLEFKRQDLIATTKTLRESLFVHLRAEEDQLIPFLNRSLSAGQQRTVHRQIVKQISKLASSSSANKGNGKLRLVAMTEAVFKFEPELRSSLERKLPWILREILIPMWYQTQYLPFVREVFGDEVVAHEPPAPAEWTSPDVVKRKKRMLYAYLFVAIVGGILALLGTLH